jgi:hypothetical protein
MMGLQMFSQMATLMLPFAVGMHSISSHRRYLTLKDMTKHIERKGDEKKNPRKI